MTLRSANPVEGNDVVIDWGDGTVEAISDGKYAWKSEKQYDLEHDYASSITSANQRFIVKIYGKNYYTFRHNSYPDNNLISRIFDKDLPLATHIGTLASTCLGAKRLLKVKFPSYTAPYSDIYIWSSTFKNCKNIISITGFEDIYLKSNSLIEGTFEGCSSLIETDFIIPPKANIIYTTFRGCTNLAVDINTLIPKNGFSSTNIEIAGLFNNASMLSGNVPADKLWNDKNITWNITPPWSGSKLLPFTGCSDEILAQVPMSWGGTASDDIIDDNLSYDDVEINTLLSAKADLVGGKVPESQLPDLLKLGETSTTAFSGDRGKALEDKLCSTSFIVTDPDNSNNPMNGIYELTNGSIGDTRTSTRWTNKSNSNYYFWIQYNNNGSGLTVSYLLMDQPDSSSMPYFQAIDTINNSNETKLPWDNSLTYNGVGAGSDAKISIKQVETYATTKYVDDAIANISLDTDTETDYTKLNNLPTLSGNIISGSIDNTLTNFVKNTIAYNNSDTINISDNKIHIRFDNTAGFSITSAGISLDFAIISGLLGLTTLKADIEQLKTQLSGVNELLNELNGEA